MRVAIFAGEQQLVPRTRAQLEARVAGLEAAILVGTAIGTVAVGIFTC